MLLRLLLHSIIASFIHYALSRVCVPVNYPTATTLFNKNVQAFTLAAPRPVNPTTRCSKIHLQVTTRASAAASKAILVSFFLSEIPSTPLTLMPYVQQLGEEWGLLQRCSRFIANNLSWNTPPAAGEERPLSNDQKFTEYEIKKASVAAQLEPEVPDSLKRQTDGVTSTSLAPLLSSNGSSSPCLLRENQAFLYTSFFTRIPIMKSSESSYASSVLCSEEGMILVPTSSGKPPGWAAAGLAGLRTPTSCSCSS